MNPTEIELIYELSPMQQAMLFFSLLAPTSGVYVIQMSLRLTGALNLAAFERAWRRVIERHGILRTAFFYEGLEKPLQVVYRKADLPLRCESWLDVDPAEQKARLASFLDAERERGFDPGEAPLMRLSLFELGAGAHQMVWSIHHLLVDGWSQGQLLRELFTCYAAYADGGEPRLAPVRSFRDYIAWLQRQDTGAAEAFWRTTLAGFSSPTLLAGAEGPAAGPTWRASRRRDRALPAVTTAALREAARKHRLTLNTLVQGAWALLLAQESGREDVAFGTTVSGRPADLQGMESTLGLFINTQPVRVEVRPEQRLWDWLSALQERQVATRRYEHSSLVDVQRWSELPAGAPLFDHLLVFENVGLPPGLEHPLPGLEIVEEAAQELTNYPLNVVVLPGARELLLTMRYDAGRFEEPRILRLLERLAGVLTAFAEDRDVVLGNLPLLCAAERQQLLEWGGTAGEPSPETLHGRFAAQARRSPAAVAAVCGPARLTYGELNARANQLAWHLRSLGIGPDARVGLCAERSLDLLIGLLGILKAGGAYVPLDPGYPRERRLSTLEDAGIGVLVGTRDAVADLPSTAERVLLDAEAERLAGWPVDDPPDLSDGGHLAYVIYTSGSTGRPKGALLAHGHVVRLFDATDAWFGFGARDVWTLFHSAAFDFSVWEIWGALLYGGRLVVVPYLVSRSPEDFHALLVREGVTVLNQTPSAFAQLQRVDEAPERQGQLRDLRLVIFGGEALDPGSLAPWFERHGDARPRLVNMYGITETTVHVTGRPLAWSDVGRRSVIGGPIPDLAVYVLDPWLRPVPLGVAGELLVAGAGVARGYLDRPDLTAERFIPDPVSGRPGARAYRSGDLARYLPNGDLEYLGRIDHQVKIRGFRIELGEIESVLSSHPAVRECVVLARRDDPRSPGDAQLVAYLLLDPKSRLEHPKAFFSDLLRRRLPEHMVPSACVVLDAFPLTANGKVDRRALPVPERSGAEEAAYVPPSDPVEELIAGVWAEVLGLERVGLHDQFFALGGHSLLATRVMSRLRGVLGVDLPLRMLFEAPTVAELAQAIRESRRSAPAPRIVRVPRGGELPLSFGQQRLWLIDQLDPGNPAFNIPLAVRLTGEVAPAVLARIFGEIVRRHEVLRTTFEAQDGRPVQVIAPAPELEPELHIVDLAGLPEAGRAARARELVREEARRPFDLRRGPLLRLQLVRLGARDHLLLLTLHHIVADGWSLGVLLREIAALYPAFSLGLPSPLPGLPVQYADFAAWQRSWLSGEVLAEQLGWWRKELEGAPAALDLPADRPRSVLHSRAGALLPVALPAGLTAGVRELARQEGATPFLVLLTAFQTLLHRVCGQDDVLVGTPVANRDAVEIEPLIGFFVNTLVLRGRFAGEGPTFRDRLERTRATVLAAFEHKDAPFERLVDELALERNLAVSPLFQVLFSLQTAPAAPITLPRLTLEPLPVDVGLAKLDLSLYLTEGDGGAIRGTLEISRALFDRVTAERLMASFLRLLQGAVEAPEARVAELPLLDEAQRHQVVLEWSRNGALPPGCVSIVPLFERRVAQTPDAPALSHQGRRFTYRELDGWANRLARRLHTRGVGRETPVAVLAERSPELIAAFLGILKAGGVYVPLDPAYPPERLAFMRDDARAALLLTPDEVAREASGEEAGAAFGRNGHAPAADQLAYVLYTSGSTGRPKGVMVSHGALARYTEAVRKVYAIGPADRVLQFCSTSFDTSLEETVPCLTGGAELVLRTDAMLASPAVFLESCREQGVTALSLPTAYWHEVAAKVESEGLAIPSGLRLVILGGERALLERVESWRRHAPGPRLVNTYGVTESTIVSTAVDLAAPSPAEARGEVSIGRAIGGTELHLLDREGAPVPIGALGELYIGGGLLARGYLGRPDLTAERFLPHPFPGSPGDRLYRTGDLARMLPDGSLELAGRADRQIKVRGYRIEVAEIEARLLQHPDVESAVVTVREDQPGEKRIAAYVVPRSAAAPEPAGLRAFVRETLPDYMVPGAWVLLAALPLTPNGKLDRRALPAPESDGRLNEGEEGYAAPSDPLEELLAGIWAEVLGRGRIGINDDFFTLGGHSLLATQVVSRIRGTLGAEVSLRQLFEAPTVAELARAVRAARPEILEEPIVRAAERFQPLSFAQQRLWVIDQLDPGSPAYNVYAAVRLTGEVAPALLERVFAAIVRRHEALRTTFEAQDGRPVQVIAPAGTARPALPVLDLSRLPADEREVQAFRLAREEVLRPFDLQRGPLLRLALVRLEARDHLLLLTMHHIVSDGWSMGVLLREFATLHAAFAQGLPSPLPELPVQYGDFAVWQRRRLQGEVLDAQLAVWRRRLAGAPQVLELPTDRPRPAVQSLRGATRPVAFPPALSAALLALCRSQGATPFMALLAAWSVLLGRLADQDDLLVGTPIAGRHRREIEPLIGFFVNTLAVRVELAGHPGFTEVLRRVRAATLEAFTHQDLPFERLVEELVPQRDLSRAPLFQTMFVLQNAFGEVREIPGLALRTVTLPGETSRFDLSLALAETPSGLAGLLEHSTDLFDGSTVERLLARFATVLEGVVREPGRPVAELPWLLEGERQQVLVEGNDTEAACPRDASLSELFAAVAAATPEAPAVVDASGEVWSYRRLAEAARGLAGHLSAQGIAPGDRVGVAMERSADLIVAFLGVLEAGAAYVPLDPGYPEERLAFLKEDAGVRVVLSDLASPTVETPRGASPAMMPGGDSLAYVLYTSGSTGRPKGVAVPHRAILRLVFGTEALRLRPDDRLAFNANPSFDAATWEIWATLLSGAALVVIPQGVLLSPPDLGAVLRRERVTVLHLTAALFHRVVSETPEILGTPSLRRVLFGGEASDPATVARARAGEIPERLFHMYGPTESTTFATFQEVGGLEPGAATVPIGRPLGGTRTYVLDRAGAPVALGQPGELLLGGDGLAWGYLGRPELTAAAFVPDPWSAEPGGRLYRTGDLVRLRGDGRLEFQGRIDHQVKIRGFRIEPGEVEALLASHPEVAACAVLARRDGGGETRLVAYVVLDRTAATPDLPVWLRQRLPEHLVPSVFVVLEALPLTPNGKVDRRALPAPQAADLHPAAGSVAPSGPEEETLAAIWAEVLGRDRVGARDNFFALGGHSLLATQVMSRLRGALGVELPLRTLFERPTVAELAGAVRRARAGDGLEAPPLVPLPPMPRAGGVPLSFAQQRLWFLDQLAPESPAYNMPLAVRLTGGLPVDLLARVFTEIVRRHEALRTTFASEKGQPVQIVAAPRAVQLPVCDLSHLPDLEREAEALRLTRAEALRPFDLRRGPLLRMALVRLEEQDHLLLLTLHHVVSDGWSMGVLLREIAALHAAFAQGLPSPLPELPVQYPDFAAWQRSWLQGEALEAQLAAWTRRLDGAPQVLDLPTDRPRPAVQTFRGAARSVAVAPALSADLLALCRREQVTPFMALLAAWSVLLGRLAGQDDLLIGTPIAGRNRREIEPLIGFFVNTLALRIELRDGCTVSGLLAQVRETALDAFAHQDLPFERLVEELAPQRDLARPPLFQVMFALQNAPAEALEVPGLTLRPVPLSARIAKFDLELVLSEGPDGLAGLLEHNADLFDGSTIERLAARLGVVLAGIVDDPGRPLAGLPWLLDGERQQVLVEANDTRRSDAWEASLPELFAAVVEAAPEAPAVIDASGDVWSYRRLAGAASRLAAHLRELGIAPGDRVGVAMERSADLIVAFLGVLEAGAAYVPLDPGSPEERLAFLIEDAGVRVVLADLEFPTVETPRGASPAMMPGGDSLAYVIYTSGSTGRPKGVAVPHRAILRLVFGTPALCLRPDDRLAFNANPSFDAATWEIWATLLAGAALVVIPQDVLLAPRELAAVLLRERVTVLHLTTALFNRVVAEAPEVLGTPSLRLALFGGEASDPGAVARALAGEIPERLLHMYGPTESTTFATFQDLAGWAPGAAPVPIGRPLGATQAYVLDRAGEPAALGQPGELFLGGDGLARGYLGRPELTAAAFVPDPWSAEPGGRLYRTGDLVRRRAGGALEFQGRIDQQVKIRGFRIEPGEVEAVLTQHPAVAACAVLARRDGGETRLVAYVVPAAGVELTAEGLREDLKRTLPDHLVPAVFVLLDALPLTPNGKVDRRALPAPQALDLSRQDYVAPSDPVEETLAAIWAEVLGLDRVGARDDFFALGGHSLLATQVTSRLRAAFGVELPLRTLFERPTLTELAGAVRTARAEERLEAPPLLPVPRTDDLPLSFAQQRLWLLDQLEPDSPAYNMPLAVRLTGALPAGRLERVFTEIVRRHEALRTTFIERGGSPVQAVAPPSAVRLPVCDLSGLPERDGEAQAFRLAREEALRPFDLRRGPLLRLALIRLAPGDHLLLLTLHHVVSDGWSMGVLLREIAALHAAFAQGLPSPLPELPVQYPDFAAWQRSWLRGEVLEAQLAAWKRRLAGAPQVLDLPTDRPRPAVQTFRGAARPVAFPPALSAAVPALCRSERVTPFMLLLAAWSALLGRLAGQDDLLIGTPIAGRNRRETENLIGFFVNTLALRIELKDGPTVSDLLAQVRETALDAFAHQDLPFERLVEELAPQRDLARPPLFQVMFALQNAPAEALEVAGLALRPVPLSAGIAKFDLELTLAEGPQGLAGVLEHNADLFDGSTIERLAARLGVVLEGIVDDPGRPLAGLPWLLDGERQQVLVEANDTRRSDAREASLPGLFAAVVEATPEAPAVIDASGDVWSYRRLAGAASRLAAHLRELGIAPGDRVGVAMERSADLVVAFLGVLDAGAAYVPLDPGYPEERLAFLVEDAGIKVVLSDLESPIVETPRGASPKAVPAADSLAYVIYTSGSTGRPKGVAVPHRAILRLVFGTAALRLRPDDRLAFNANPSFDAATWEIWATLLSGAALVVIPQDVLLAPRELAAVLRRERVTVLHLTTALFNRVVAEAPEVLGTPSLRLALFGGEASDPGAVARALAGEIPERLLHMYGPTESTTFATFQDLAGWAPGAAPVPIGRPLGATQAYVLDRAGEPAALGQPGELFLGGDGLAWGYLGRPELTAAAFVPDPWSAEPGGRLYRTGDLVRRRAGGALEFHGRIDQQVKIRGFRIEPGEIEAVLSQHPAVAACAVLARRDGGADARGDARLVAYVVPAAGVELTAESLREDLKRTLPDHLVPSVFVLLDALPLTPNGKVDRRALPAPQALDLSRQDYVAPSDPVEETLAAIWAEVLGLDRVGARDDFFALGGHSLLATRVMSRVRQALGAELPLRTLFEQPTVARLAGAVRAARTEAGLAAPPLVPMPPRSREGDLPLSFAQQRLWFLDQLEPDSPAYNVPLAVRLTGTLSIEALERTCAEIVRRHEALRTVFTRGTDRPAQVVRDAATARPELTLLDLSDAPEEARAEWELRLALEEARQPFDLARGPLLRLVLLRRSAHEHLLLATLHHIVSDGWSMGVLLREVAALYGAFVHGRPSPLPELPVQFADFAVWQRGWLQGDALERQLAYWKQALAGAPTVLELPTDRPRPAMQTSNGAAADRLLPAALGAEIRALCRREGATPFMLLLAAWAVVLGRHAGQDDVLVGTPVAGRHRREIEDLIGFFVNTLVLRASWTSSGATFRDVLAGVRAAALDGFAHQDLPFERLVEELVPARDLSTSPLFQVMFTLEAAAAGGLSLPGLSLAPLALDNHLAKFDLTLTVGEGEGGDAASLEYNADLFDAATAERLLARFAALLAAAVARPDQAVVELPLLPPEERHQLLVEWNDTAAAVRSGVRLEELFAARAAAHPDALAVVFEGEELSYGGLAARVHRLAQLLVEQGVGRGTPVGVWMERSIHLPVAALGILEAGGVYVPLDAAWPAERVRAVLSATRSPVLLVSRATLSAAETLRWRLPHLDDVICPDLAAEPEPETVDTASVRALFDYVAERATDRVTAGGFVSSFTGLPFSEAEVDEYRDRVLALAAPWLRPNARVLEIGSGSGLLLWEMARRVARAVGLDPSERTQERNRAAAEADGRANVELPAGFAHEIGTLFPPASFDLVVLASTVQFFPGTRYLEHVLAAALDLLAPGGALLVADVMDARREEELARALALADGGHSTAGTELWIDEDLFRDWASGLPDAAAPEVLHRTEGFANELGYRYDVIVRKQPPAEPRTARRRKRTWTGRHLESRPATPPRAERGPDDVAYVIHTSGSTGVPKAIVVQHGPAVRLVDWVNETFGVGPDDRLLFVTSPAFDLSIYDLFGPLAAGAAIQVAPEQALRDPEHLLRLLRDEPITVWDSAPAALQQLAPLFTPAPDAPLRLVLLSGDWIPVPLPDQVRSTFPRARVVSLGGATEATVWSNWYPVGDVDPAWPSIPYGRPMANARYLVLDDALWPSPIGVSGDLYIGGACLATGYADPDLTAAAFLPDPFASAPGARLYRTGDRARCGRDGNLELLGRRDQQVKVRGYRIELGEIEAALLRHPAVREAVVLVREDHPGQRMLVAYVVPRLAETADEGTLRAWLGRALPAYMVPTAFVRLDAFPVTANGKLDRQALPAPERRADASLYVPPGDEIEETLATLWQEILGLDRIGIHDNFFTLGGHSLVATQVISRIRELFGVDLPLRRLFEMPTIAQLAQVVREERGRE